MSAYFNYALPNDDVPIFVRPLLPSANAITIPHHSAYDPKTKKWDIKQTSICKETATWLPINATNLVFGIPGGDCVSRDRYILTVSTFIRELPQPLRTFVNKDGHVGEEALALIGWKAEHLTEGIMMEYNDGPSIRVAARFGRYVGARSYLMNTRYVDLLEGHPGLENPAGDEHRRTAEEMRKFLEDLRLL